MKKNIVCTTSLVSSGNTFLNWSIYFLSGTQKHLLINNNFDYEWNTLVNNPLTRNNAHLFKKIHSKGSYGFNRCLDIIKNERDALYCLYPGRSTNSEWTQQQKLDDLNYLISTFKENNIHWIHNDSRGFFKNYKERGEHVLIKDGTVIEDRIEATIQNAEYYFGESRKKFENSYSGTREWLALHFDHILDKNSQQIDLSNPHLYIEETSLWFDGEYVLQQVMDYCELDIVKKQWFSWQKIYKRWQEIHLEQIRLSRNIEYVCNAIVNSWHHDLTQYNLDLLDEAYILHNLLKKHSTNIKGSDLQIFPNNTKDFRDFLELTDLYATK